jgi:RNA polymerase sigma factor (sigma-70 family)
MGVERRFRPDQRIERLYRDHATGAVRFAYLLTGDRELAQDLAHDAFVAIAGRAEMIEPEAFPAYLRKTVLNLVRMHARRRGVERAYLTRQRSGSPETSEPQNASYLEFRHSLYRLPYRQRAAIVLRYYEDLPERQIAELLHCRPGTVKSLLSRGLRSLRTELGSWSEEDEADA